MSYKVNTATYSGPFDLLLQLVSRQKVAIGSISISEVASTLLDMKAHALVPQDVSLKSSYDEDEYDDELDGLSPDEAREVLIARLIAYKQFRNAGAALGSRMEAESYMFPRSVGPDPDFLNLMPDYLEGITLRSLAVICADIDSKRETFLLEAEHVAPKRLPVALTVASVDRLTRSKGKVTFSELLDGQDTPEIVVANFLAVLELFKRGLVRVQQDVIFGEIEIEHIEGADSYQLDESVLLELEELSGDEPDLEGFNLSQNALDDVQQTLLSLTQTPDEAQKEAE